MSSRPLHYTEQFVIKLTKRARQLIRDAAARRRMSSSQWLRYAAAASLRDPDAPTLREIIDALVALRGELGRIGNLLNQIARALNSGQSSPPTALGDALADLARLRQQIGEAVAQVRAS